jgi:hypothetical protein
LKLSSKKIKNFSRSVAAPSLRQQRYSIVGATASLEQQHRWSNSNVAAVAP